MLKVFYGRIRPQHACALLQFHKKGIVQQLIHHLKYRRQEQIGEFLGAWMGSELKTIHNYQTIDYVIPVPLHPKKLKKRGYNQVNRFAQTIAKAIHAEFRNDILLKTNHSTTQTIKNRLKRWQDLETTYKVVNPEILNRKHLLIADDIITTGATIEACVKELQHHADCSISIASMAITI
ncbi:ComF family protein [Zhouia spongiae]|uniref:ComF family protein n=1 Tax=Zhouia spongiae TaxID=2202721 RepID=A0ABY3YQH8_9FLAO|nr:ComF family protein [Zhouia spongiae]UNZ00095.1 ComF family protein [Zhouia spongiae]